MTTHDAPDLAQLQEQLYITALSGQRQYYPHTTVNTGAESATGNPSAIVFNILTVIPYHMLRDKVLYKKTDRTMDWLVEEVGRRTRANTHMKFSRRLDNQWPATVFDEWLEDTFDNHWMSATWYQHEDSMGMDDYALMINVHVPVETTAEEFETAYGEAFTMTKLMHYN
jgi:hypothetical protein